MRKRTPPLRERPSAALVGAALLFWIETGMGFVHRGRERLGVVRVEVIARRFGLDGEIVPVKTADVKLLAPRPLRGGLRVDRAAALLRNKPLGIDEALERFHDEWAARGG